jgi:hypothetical protein
VALNVPSGEIIIGDEDDVSAYIANNNLEQIEDYVRRGRQLASMTIEDLKCALG